MDCPPSVIIATESVSLPATAAFWGLETYGEKTEGGKGLAVITQASLLGGDLKLAASSLDVLVSLSQGPTYHNGSLLTKLMKFLKPGGILVAQEPQSSNIPVKENLEKSLLLAGYVNAKQCLGCTEGAIAIKAVKPMWETGASFSLKKTAVVPQGAKAVKLATFDVDDDYDLIDEDSLLTEEDLKRPELPKAPDDCEVGKSGKKACKNCTCGRAEMESSGKLSLTVEELNKLPQSSCGSCGLGDAFRCSTCPYKGMPPFKPGEKISLSGSLLTADM